MTKTTFPKLIRLGQARRKTRASHVVGVAESIPTLNYEFG